MAGGLAGALAEVYADFLAAHPDFATTGLVDQVRARDFGRLDALGQLCWMSNFADAFAFHEFARELLEG